MAVAPGTNCMSSKDHTDEESNRSETTCDWCGKEDVEIIGEVGRSDRIDPDQFGHVDDPIPKTRLCYLCAHRLGGNIWEMGHIIEDDPRRVSFGYHVYDEATQTPEDVDTAIVGGEEMDAEEFLKKKFTNDIRNAERMIALIDFICAEFHNREWQDTF